MLGVSGRKGLSCPGLACEPGAYAPNGEYAPPAMPRPVIISYQEEEDSNHERTRARTDHG